MTLRHSSLAFLTLILAVVLSGCDLLGENEAEDTPAVSTAGVYVANQGNFGDGNGSVTFYTPEDENSQPTFISDLQSTVQGIAISDSSLLVMSNSAARIDVFAADDATQEAQITELSGPRYATIAEEETAYVTDQAFAGPSSVRVLDRSGTEPQLSSTIEVSGTPEGITTAGSRVYAALGAFGDTTLVAAIDRQENTLEEEIDVDCTPRSIAADGDGDVFALCSNSATAVILDAARGTVASRLSLPDTAETAFNVGQPASYAPAAQELYVATDSGVVRIDTESNTVATTLEVDGPAPIGAVAYDGLREELYVATVPSFTERGTVTIYDRDGVETGSFQAGIAPTYIEFRRIEI